MWARRIIATLALAHCSPPWQPGEIPPKPNASPTTSTSVVTFALDSISLSETSRTSSIPDPNAWAGIGYDLDGIATSASSSNGCSLSPGTPISTQLDGDGGIDNAWGHIVLPIVENALSIPTPSTFATAAIQNGQWTLLFQVEGLPDNDLQRNAIGLTIRAFVGGPTNDTATWPVRASSLIDGGLGSGAVVEFANAYVNNDMIVGKSDAVLSIPILFRVPFLATFGAFGPLVLRIHHPVVTMPRIGLDGGTAVGTIAGVLDPTEMVEALVNSNVSPSVCNGASELTGPIARAQDISADEKVGTGVTCDAISIGLGFTATIVADPTSVIPDPPVSNVCDAGAD